MVSKNTVLDPIGPRRHKSYRLCLLLGGVALSAFRLWGQKFPGERTSHSEMDTAAFAWQEDPVLEAGEMSHRTLPSKS